MQYEIQNVLQKSVIIHAFEDKKQISGKLLCSNLFMHFRQGYTIVSNKIDFGKIDICTTFQQKYEVYA